MKNAICFLWFICLFSNISIANEIKCSSLAPLQSLRGECFSCESLKSFETESDICKPCLNRDVSIVQTVKDKTLKTVCHLKECPESNPLKGASLSCYSCDDPNAILMSNDKINERINRLMEEGKKDWVASDGLFDEVCSNRWIRKVKRPDSWISVLTVCPEGTKRYGIGSCLTEDQIHAHEKAQWQKESDESLGMYMGRIAEKTVGKTLLDLWQSSSILMAISDFFMSILDFILKVFALFALMFAH